MDSFTVELCKVFDQSREVACLVDFSIEFFTVAAESEWNAPSLFDAFYSGLSDCTKDELAARLPLAKETQSLCRQDFENYFRVE